MAKLGWKKTQINNIYELQDAVMDMPDAIERPVHVAGRKVDEKALNEEFTYNELKDQKGFYEPEYKALVNSKTGEITNIVTDNYQVIQHRPFFGGLISDLESLDLVKLRGAIICKDGGNAYIIRLDFPNEIIKEPKVGDNVTAGVEFYNSIDRSTAATGNAFFMRLSCTNGMMMKHLIPDCDFYKSHKGKSQKSVLEQLSTRTNNFMKTIINSKELMTGIIGKAMDSEIIFENPVQLNSSMEEMFTTKKHSEEIAYRVRKTADKRADGKIQTDRWKIYNSITEYTSHTAMSPEVFNQILVKAESKVLDTRGKIPLPVPQLRRN
jgi:hypothetical protein